jgi:adenosylhomocysteine nucleosidase
MKVLFVAALAEEVAALAAEVPVLELGVGKVQAATALAARLAWDPADLVINVGTAGGLTGQPVGEVVEVARVHQHDFDHRGVSAFVGRSIPGGPIELHGPPGATGRLATGDRVITDADERARLSAHADLVDMEGYAVAAAGLAFEREVWLVKAVSDSADGDTVGSWADALARCSERLAAWADGHGLLDAPR